MDDRLEDFGQAGLFGDVPAEGLEEGVEDLGAELFFFVVRRQEDLAVGGAWDTIRAKLVQSLGAPASNVPGAR